jgi:hypothetical protein
VIALGYQTEIRAFKISLAVWRRHENQRAGYLKDSVGFQRKIHPRMDLLFWASPVMVVTLPTI